MRRRYRRQARRMGSLSPLAIAGICVAGVILLTVLVGNLLTFFLDDETYARLTGGEPEEEATEVLHKTALPDINAYPHVLGSNAAKAADFPAVSVSLNKPDGTLNYTSEVSSYQNLVGEPGVPLTREMQELSYYTPYISGVFYPRAFDYDTPDLRFAATAAEGALLREFMRNGARDVILVSIPFERVARTDILSYIQSVKRALGENALGVAVPLSVAQSAGGWELLNALLEVCDFCALDVTQASQPREDGTLPDANEILGYADYFLTQYDMRLLLHDGQTNLRAEAELRMIADYQIIKAPPTQQLPEESEPVS